ncbi:WAT1-related protein At5g47470-like [Abrus precatorius]|uniref:WAT1-related protein n=1 Tax=Abrus precatorius TaxID=3816 RepID=A0A8B8M634_ABRPR|nr:WAT1-related protein At5g47470-like [Abrus precatorius]
MQACICLEGKLKNHREKRLVDTPTSRRLAWLENGIKDLLERQMQEQIMEDIAIIGGLIGVQFVYAGNAVLMGYSMSLGFSSLTIIVFTSLATFLILFPIAFCFERSKWPKNCSLKLIMQISFLSFGGLAFQYTFLKGINLTSPAMGTAMPNLAPGFIFIIAWTFGLEKVNLRNKVSKVKILGTLLCVLGALTMSVMQSLSAPATKKDATVQLSRTPSGFTFDIHKIMGCVYLMVSVLILSSSVVMQAFALGNFPAPMSLGAITSLFGALITAFVQLLGDREPKLGSALLSYGNLICCSVLAGAVSGMCLSFNGWALKKRGPVFVSMFNPIGTVCSVIFSVVTTGDTINIGSLVGMLLMFTGLYSVLWAKGKEGHADGDGLESEFDAERPLLC